jgi:hypothetical protein
MKHNGHKKKDLLLRPQQIVIQLTDRFELLSEFAIVIQPLLHLLMTVRGDTDLFRLAARIAHGEDPDGMAAATLAFGTAAAMADEAMQQRAAEDLIARRQVGQELAAGADRVLVLHHLQ